MLVDVHMIYADHDEWGLWWYLVAWLSQCTSIGFPDVILSSDKILWARALSSASTLLLDTTDCFLLFHVTKFPETRVQYSVVDLMSIFELAQLAASVKISMFLFIDFLKYNPSLGVPFKYQSIL